MTSSSVVVAGGGLAGLRAALELATDEYDVRLFERESTVGGRVRTETDEPYQFDRGFQVLLTAYPEVQSSLDLSALDLRRFPSGATVCRPNHRSTIADPFREPTKLFETAFSRDVTIGDKLKTVALRRELRGKSVEEIFQGPDETILESLRNRGFSDRFVRRFAAPFYGGITLDRSLSTSKRVFEYTFKMFAEGSAAVPADGMGAITEQLADRARAAGVSIETETPVQTVERYGDGVSVEVDGTTVSADAAVVATDPPTSAALTGVDAIPTEGKDCTTQYLSVSSVNPISDQPYILVNGAGEIPNQVAPIGVVAPEYGPDDAVLLSATTLENPSVSESELFERTRDVLASWYPEASFESLSLERSVRCDFAQFAQPPGVHETLPDVRAPDGPIYLAGDYTMDSSINGALASGRIAAEAVREDLQ
ncbi:MAG: NAD(P)/FAD-dependent oxidoreductase [archaeon]